MHTGSSLIRKSSELTLKYFVRSFRSVPDSLTKILFLNSLYEVEEMVPFSRNSGPLAKYDMLLYPYSICTSPGEHLLLSSIGASLESHQDLIGSGRQELKSCRFVSKTHDYQKYGALIPEEMINQAIKDSKAYKTYLAFAIGQATTKKARKFKKNASPSKKLSPVLEEWNTAKNLAAKKTSQEVYYCATAGVIIRDHSWL
ncbi:hypothetical protein Tco_0307913 [Tanacetum coccineum]